jgi:hypothetical protein
VKRSAARVTPFFSYPARRDEKTEIWPGGATFSKLSQIMRDQGHQERRTRRSQDTMMALHYQLALARFEGEFEALVLTDAAGCLVAGAGPWPTCEMLAAFAPILGTRRPGGGHDTGRPSGVEIRRVMIDGSEVLLCARGGGHARVPSITRAASGCRRILGGEA